MNNGPNHIPATIESDELTFSKEGRLSFDGLVEHSYVEGYIEDMTKLLPSELIMLSQLMIYMNGSKKTPKHLMIFQSVNSIFI